MKKIISLVIVFLIIFSSMVLLGSNEIEASNSGFVTRNGKVLMLNEQRFRFVGANTYWLGLRETPNIDYPSNEDIDRLFTDAQALGVDVIRTFAALSCGTAGSTNKSIQPALGIWNETALRMLDKVLQLANYHNIRLILPLVDQYEYYHGGIGIYTGWRGLGDKYLFFTDSTVKQDYKNFVNMIINRINYYTGVQYKNDPAIFCWELGNELWHADSSSLDTWVNEMSNYIKSLDSNHLVMTGAMKAGIGLQSSADIITHHVYPNLAPSGTTDLKGWMVNDQGYATYIAKNLADEGNGKPIIFGEFGWSEQFAFDGISHGMQERNEVYEALLKDAYDKDNDGVSDFDADGIMVWHLSTKQDAMADIDPLYYDLIYRPPYPSSFNDLMGQTMDMLKYWQQRMKGTFPAVPSAPTELSCTPVNKGVKLSWSAISDATSYNIKRSTSSSGPFNVIAYGVTGNYFTDTTAVNGTSYYYKINAERNDTGGISSDSSVFGPISPTEWDHMWNFDCMYSYTSNLGFDSSSPSYFGGDTSRLFRPAAGAQDQNIIYYKPDHTIASFSIVTYHWPGEPVQDFVFYTSPDGNNWTTWVPRRIYHGGNWVRIDYCSDDNHVIPSSTKYFKVCIPNTQQYWNPQISGLSITYSNTNIADDLIDWSKIYSHTTNLQFDTSNPAYMEGDISRLCRTGIDGVNQPVYPRENIVYKLSDIRYFKAISYYWIGTGEENPPEMLFETSEDGVKWTPFAPKLTVSTISESNWKKHVYEASDIPSGVNYLRINFRIGGKRPWTPQLGRVEISN